jgi:hypothetical protein
VKEEAPDFRCPNEERDATYAHEEYCDKYYECINGNAALVTCPDGLLYDNRRALHGSKCDDPFNNIDCGNRTRLRK